MDPRYVARRLLLAAGALAGILVVTFFLVHLAPGDPVEALAGEGATQEQLAAMRRHYGLDRPLPEQFLSYAGNVVRGDFGDSYIYKRPVSGMIRERVWPTLLLATTALVVSSSAGILLGTLAARRPGRLDLGISTTTLVAYAVPAFWLAQLAVMTLALRAGWFPVQGMTDARARYTGMARTLDVARHLLLPSLVLAVSSVALLARVTRAGLVTELRKTYVLADRAAGLSDRVITTDALRNALLPVVTILGTRVGSLLSGAVLVETVFAWPGLGRMLLDASNSRDYPVVLGMVLLVSFTVVVANLVTDLLYAWIDPRIRLR